MAELLIPAILGAYVLGLLSAGLIWGDEVAQARRDMAEMERRLRGAGPAFDAVAQSALEIGDTSWQR